jgi:D-Tyr-tRNAtyr deacylase
MDGKKPNVYSKMMPASARDLYKQYKKRMGKKKPTKGAFGGKKTNKV